MKFYTPQERSRFGNKNDCSILTDRCAKPRKLRNREYKLCLNTRAIVRLLNLTVDCNIDKSIKKFPITPLAHSPVNACSDTGFICRFAAGTPQTSPPCDISVAPPYSNDAYQEQTRCKVDFTRRVVGEASN